MPTVLPLPRNQFLAAKERELRAAAPLIQPQHSGSTESDISGLLGTGSRSTSGAGTTGYETVMEEGTALVQRRKINFIGAGVTAADDAANNRTNVTISGGGSGLTHGEVMARIAIGV